MLSGITGFCITGGICTFIVSIVFLIAWLLSLKKDDSNKKEKKDNDYLNLFIGFLIVSIVFFLLALKDYYSY